MVQWGKKSHLKIQFLLDQWVSWYQNISIFVCLFFFFIINIIFIIFYLFFYFSIRQKFKDYKTRIMNLSIL